MNVAGLHIQYVTTLIKKEAINLRRNEGVHEESWRKWILEGLKGGKKMGE